jgi:glycyl-tRNA synthetase beta chain
VAAFIGGRLEGMLKERGHAYDIVAAVMAVAADDPADTLARCEALTAFRGTEAGADLLVAFRRAVNLADESRGSAPDCSVMGDEERALFDAVVVAESEVHGLVRERLYSEAVGVLADLRAPVDVFFEKVLVMDPDPAVRDNRVQLLNRAAGLFAGFADLTMIEG